MTDREMFEFAAMAMQKSGDTRFANFHYVDEVSGICLELGSRRGAATAYWNPRRYDGDALRLAAALNISICPSVLLAAYCTFEGPQSPITEPHRGDKMAAIRLAIFRCAVEIGKQLP